MATIFTATAQAVTLDGRCLVSTDEGCNISTKASHTSLIAYRFLILHVRERDTIVKIVQRARNLATAVFALFTAGAALAQAAGAGVGLRYAFAATAMAGALVALGLWWLEHEAAHDDETDARFARALGLLGESGARQGGIYQMESIARDVPAHYHRTMLEVLTAYIKERAPWPPVLTESAGEPEDESDRRPPADVQAAITVLGRRDPQHDEALVLRLSRVDLRGASLRGAAFDGVRLRGAHLEHAQLEGATLRDSRLRKAHLEYADLAPNEDLDLPAADLTRAVLVEANFARAKLMGVDFTGAALRRANLRGANLQDATLANADLTGAIYDAATVWPADFDLAKAGCSKG